MKFALCCWLPLLGLGAIRRDRIGRCLFQLVVLAASLAVCFPVSLVYCDLLKYREAAFVVITVHGVTRVANVARTCISLVIRRRAGRSGQQAAAW